jgi:hypothetical protein
LFKRLLKKLVPLFDVLLLPAMLAAIGVMRLFRRLPLLQMRLNRRLLEALGVFPILGIYHEPSYRRSDLWRDPAAERHLPGLDLNLPEQLRLLDQFGYQAELAALPCEKPGRGGQPRFYYHNCSFESGDAEYLYAMVRRFKPARFMEVGSGYSTLMVREALAKNQAEDAAYACRHQCIEPFVNYWNAWLDQLPVEIIRRPVEKVDLEIFRGLRPRDILFLDSSHVIRPQGDVLFEYLEILPSLPAGVFIHIHDIYTPRDYQALWRKDLCFDNEQYLLEALLTQNSGFKIIGALNHLAHREPAALAAKFPIYAREQAFRQPGSFWLEKL